jgi:hypothetical protein
MRAGRRIAIVVVLASLAACGAAASGTLSARRAIRQAHWVGAVHLSRPLDVAVRTDGSVIVAAAGRLYSLGPTGTLTRFAPAYRSPGGEEAYIAAPGAVNSCFGADTVYAIRLRHGRGITRISRSGRVTRFANIGSPGLIDGITFDPAGGFDYRMLVTINHGATSSVDVINCDGSGVTLTRSAPRVEGGLAVAPASFGRYAGDLIAPDETSGRIFAVTPNGGSRPVADSGLPHGGDIGVESEAFVPSSQHYRTLVADRFTPGNRHPGDDVLLTVSSAALSAAGVAPGDLLVTTEGGALTDAITCGGVRCSVRYVASGPPRAHGEGHVAFTTR